MAITVTVRTGDDGNPVELLTAAHIAVAGLDPWTADPTEDDAFAIDHDVYYVKATDPAGNVYESYRFTPSADGDHEWDGFVFPVDGSWSLDVMKVGSPDSSVKTQAVTVAAAS